jgi:hypothetical protein
MPSGKSPIDPHDLESRLRQLEAIHRSLGDEIAALRTMQREFGLSTFVGTIDPPAPYHAKTRPEATPKPKKKTAKTVAHEGPPSKEQFEAARLIVMDGYTPDKPGDGDRLLKTIVYRLLDGSSKGFKSSDLASARTVAMYLIEQAGLRSGPGFRDGKLRSLLKKFVPFEPIASLRRMPR